MPNEKESTLATIVTDDKRSIDEIFADKIRKECFAEGFDNIEYNHRDADNILCDLLKMLGFVKTVETFLEVNKFYV